jgi:hypothetical protein
MKNPKLKLSFLIISTAFISQNAFAVMPVSVDTFAPNAAMQITDPIVAAITSLGSDITTEFTTLENDIGNGFNGLKTMLVAAQEQASQAQIQAIANQTATMQNMAIANQSQTTTVGANGQMVTASGCASSSIANYASSAKQVASYNKSVAGGTLAAKAGNAPPAAIQVTAIQNQHYNTYCDPSTDPDGCKGGQKAGSNGGPNPADTLANADESAQTLSDGAGNIGHVSNLTYTAQQQQAATAYISNVIDGGESPRKLSDQEYKTPQGQMYEGLRIAYEAKMSLAREALTYVASSRIAIPGSYAKTIVPMENADGGSSAAYLQAQMQRIEQYPPGCTGCSTGDVSPMELLTLDVGRRVDNPTWYTTINTTTNTNALLREQTLMMAQLLKIQLMRLKGEELRTALAGLNAAESTKTVMLPKIERADAAVASGLASTQQLLN